MSSISSITSSDSANYATQIAQTASLKRSLNNLGAAIQTGNLSSAGSILTSLVKNNPQFSNSATGTSMGSDPINVDFKAISDAIDKNDAVAAQGAFDQLKADLAKSSITINDGTEDTSKLLASNRASIDQAILTNTFGSASGVTDSFYGIATTASTDSTGLEGIVKDWLSYKSGGSTAPTSSAKTSGTALNVTA